MVNMNFICKGINNDIFMKSFNLFSYFLFACFSSRLLHIFYEKMRLFINILKSCIFLFYWKFASLISIRFYT